MHSFATGLIWAAYEEDKLIQTFRYMEEGSFNTPDEDEYTLPDNCTIGLVHPIDLDEDTLLTWKQQLSDYEITQPIEQLERKVYHVNNNEIGTYDLQRFKDRNINGKNFLGILTKLGWYRGAISNRNINIFDTFYREDIVKRIKYDNGTVELIGNAAILHFSGMHISGTDKEITIKNIRFYAPGTENPGNKAIMLEKVTPRYFSEIVNQIESILKVVQ